MPLPPLDHHPPCRYQTKNGTASCQACANGKYIGKTGASECVDCVSGKYAGNGSATCTACTAGKYSQDKAMFCSTCVSGTYSVTGATLCENCTEGRYSNVSSGADACTNCAGGTFSRETATFCIDCGAGKYNDGGQGECYTCAGGKYSEQGSDACVTCDAGRYAAEGADHCPSCPGGKYAGTGRSDCLECSEGYFSNDTASVCTQCVFPAYATENSDSCNLCRAGYFFSARMAKKDRTNGCIKCGKAFDDEAVECDEGGVSLDNLVVEEGWYRFESEAERAYACTYPLLCTGGNKTGQALCDPTSYGPMCTFCIKNYYMDATTLKCSACTYDSSGIIAIFVAIVVFFLMINVVVCMRKQIFTFMDHNNKKFMGLAEKCTLIFVTMQILVLMSANHHTLGGEGLPEPYGTFLEMLGLISLDFIQFVPTGCFTSSFNQFHIVASVTLTPILTFAIGQLVISRLKGGRKGQKKNVVRYAMLFVIYMLLPMISTRICESFRCDEFDGGRGGIHSYLTVDYTIKCGTTQYILLTLFAGTMVLVYPVGMPLMLLVWLSRFRHKLNPKDIPEAQALTMRTHDIELQATPVCTLAMRHRPHFWWFEIYSMVRRLCFTCGSLVFATVYQMIIFCLSFSIVTTIIQRELRPELDHKASTFSYVMHWQVVLVVLALMFMDAKMASATGEWVIGCSLLAINLLMVAFVFVNSAFAIKRHKKTANLGVSFVPAQRANLSNIPTMTNKGSGESQGGRGKSKSGESVKTSMKKAGTVKSLKKQTSFQRGKSGGADGARWRFNTSKSGLPNRDEATSADATLHGIELTHNPLTHPGVSPIAQAQRAASDEPPTGQGGLFGDFYANQVRQKKSESDGDEIKYQPNPLGAPKPSFTKGGGGAGYNDPSDMF